MVEPRNAAQVFLFFPIRSSPGRDFSLALRPLSFFFFCDFFAAGLLSLFLTFFQSVYHFILRQFSLFFFCFFLSPLVKEIDFARIECSLFVPFRLAENPTPRNFLPLLLPLGLPDPGGNFLYASRLPIYRSLG